MPVQVLVGCQWGDEGKGGIVDVLMDEFELVARYNGGDNAGHTVKVGDEEFVLHLLPSGIVRHGKKVVIGPGVVMNPKSLMNEFCYLRNKGIDPAGRLYIDERTHLILPYHRVLDMAYEIKRSRETGTTVGTTTKGIGPAYVDKDSRTGIRVIDWLDETRFGNMLEYNIKEKSKILKSWEITDEEFEKILVEITEKERKANKVLIERGLLEEDHVDHTKYYDKAKGFNIGAIIEDFSKIKSKLVDGRYIKDTAVEINLAIGAGRSVLCEGAQGTFLDVDFGTYPFVTSSHPIAGGACTGLGVGPTRIDETHGVIKAYTTRVGKGPFPTELKDGVGKVLGEKGGEVGATTGRPRRCGWFDAVIARTAVYLNGLDSISITKLDVLSGLDELKICTAYRIGERIFRAFPTDTKILDGIEPVYESFPGWKEDITNIKNYNDLPENAKVYVKRIKYLMEQAPGNPDLELKYISVGPERSQTIAYSHN